MAETEVGRLTQKQKVRSRAVEHCENTQRERSAIAEKLKEVEQSEQCTAVVLQGQ